MSEPIPIKKRTDSTLSKDDYIAVMKQRHQNHMQWAFMLTIIGVLAVFLVPLGIWLSRLAAGG